MHILDQIGPTHGSARTWRRDVNIVIIDPDRKWILSLEIRKVGSDFAIGRVQVTGKPVDAFFREN